MGWTNATLVWYSEVFVGDYGTTLSRRLKSWNSDSELNMFIPLFKKYGQNISFTSSRKQIVFCLVESFWNLSFERSSNISGNFWPEIFFVLDTTKFPKWIQITWISSILLVQEESLRWVVTLISRHFQIQLQWLLATIVS